jgi:murein DD-endopeptidase MepM/ murein hydrolase activator NlpD
MAQLPVAEGAGEAIGAGLRQFGAALKAKAEEFEDAQTLDALNQFEREADEYHNSPENGIYNTRKGKDAHGAAADADAFMKGLEDKYSASLKSPRARANFLRRAEQARGRHYEGNMRYESGQLDAYRDAEADASIKNALDDIGRNYADDAYAEQRKADIYQALELKTRGLGDEARRAAAAGMEDAAANARLSPMISENPDAAEHWFEQNIDAFSAASREKARAALASARKQKEREAETAITAAATDAFWAAHGTNERAAKAAIYADSSLEPEARDKVWRLYEARAEDERRFRAADEDSRYSAMWNFVREAGSYEEAIRGIELFQDRLSPEDVVKARGMARNFWEPKAPGEPKENPYTYLEVYEGIKDGSIKSPEQLARYADRLSDSSIKQFGKELIDGGLKIENEKISGDLDSMIDSAFKDKRTKETDLYSKTQFLKVLTDTIAMKREEKGSALGDMEKLNIASALLASSVAAENPSKWLGKKDYTMPRWEIEAAADAGFKWDSESKDFVLFAEDDATGKLVILDRWKDRKARERAGDPNAVKPQAGAGIPAPRAAARFAARLAEAASGAETGTPTGKTMRKGDTWDKGMMLPEGGKLTSPFGVRRHPGTGKDTMHYGIDIAGNMGDPVGAPKGEWRVIQTLTGRKHSNNPTDPGNQVILEAMDGSGDRVYMNHLESVSAMKGDTVSGGALLGTMGLTGFATGVHLDVKVKKDGKWVDPVPYFGVI